MAKHGEAWRSMAKRIVIGFTSIALALSLLGLIGASPVFAAKSPLKKGPTPESCFWIADASQSNNFYATNGSVAGYYEVFEQHYSCTTSYHRTLGEVIATLSSFPCTAVSFSLHLSANGVFVEGVSTPSPNPSVGNGSSCSTSYSLAYSLATSYFNGSNYAYCAEMDSVSIGGISNNSLKAGSQCP
jgi:hypothetical protein